MRPAFPKMPRVLSASPLKGAPQAPGDKRNPPRRGLKPGVTAPWGQSDVQPTRHSQPSHAECDPPAGEARQTQRVWPSQTKNASRYLSYAPPAYKSGTRPFLRWVWLQGWSPHTSGIVKNTFGPVSISLIRVPRAPGNEPHERGKSLGPEEISSAEAHLNRSVPKRAQPAKCEPTTG